MAQQDFLEVKPGEKVTAAKWNQMQRAAASTQVLLGGENTRLQVTPHGTMINAKHGGGWTHPWRVVASQHLCGVWPGTINGQFPSMVDVSGNVKKLDEKPPPHMSLLALKLGLNNVGWIALELKLKDDYRTIETAYVVQCDFIVGSEKFTNNPFFFFGLPGIGDHKVRYPIARLKWHTNQSLEIHQVSMFNLNHVCKPPAQQGAPGEQAQSALPRHFFYPA